MPEHDSLYWCHWGVVGKLLLLIVGWKRKFSRKIYTYIDSFHFPHTVYASLYWGHWDVADRLLLLAVLLKSKLFRTIHIELLP